MTLTIPDLLILILGAGYWAWVIPRKSGPYALFDRIRQRTTLGGLLLCPPCLVLWVALLFYALWQTPAAPVVTVSAVAGGATLLGHYTGTWQS